MCCPSRLDDALAGYQLWRSKAEGFSACDYSFHMSVTKFDECTEPQMRQIVADGIASFKIFLSYKNFFGVTDDEIVRVKAGLKSSLIMQEESTSARAGSIASDWFHLGRVRSFDEIQAAIDGMNPATVVEHMVRYPVQDVTLVTIGPKELTMPE